jgi:hypothetical protein
MNDTNRVEFTSLGDGRFTLGGISTYTDIITIKSVVFDRWYIAVDLTDGTRYKVGLTKS